MDKVLITGAHGFTAQALKKELAGTDFVLTDRKASEGILECELTEYTPTRALIESVRPGQVYHLAGSYSGDFDQDLSANVFATRNLLEAVRDIGLTCRVLLIGSAAEYGIPDSSSAVPETAPLRPLTNYGLTKEFQTLLMDFYVRCYHSDIVMARTFNLTGPGISPRLFPGHIQEEMDRYAKGEQKIITTGNLDAERDYLDVHEAVRLYRLIMERGESGEVYNVGSGVPVRMRELLYTWLDARSIPRDSVRERVVSEKGVAHPFSIYADISKVRNRIEKN